MRSLLIAPDLLGMLHNKTQQQKEEQLPIKYNIIQKKKKKVNTVNLSIAYAKKLHKKDK